MAEEAKKKEKQKQQNMAFFRASEPARESAESAVGRPKAPKSTWATLGNQEAQNPKMGSVSAAIQSLMQYMESQFNGLHKRIDLQDKQMGVMGTELQQITKSIGKLEQSSQVVQQEPTPKPQPAAFRAARTPDDLLRCFSCLRKAGDFMWCSVCAESPQNGLLLEADQLPRHGNWDATQEFKELKANIIRHMEGDKGSVLAQGGAAHPQPIWAYVRWAKQQKPDTGI